MRRSDILWRIAPWAAAVGAFGFFFAWIPWIASQPITEVAPDVAALMPPGCPAVFTNHAHYTCFWSGLIHDHPFKFALVTGGLVACLGMGVAAGRLGRGRSRGDRDV